MLAHYFAAVIALSTTAVLSAPAPAQQARDVESHLSARNFYWQCPQGKSFTGNPPPSSNPGSCTNCLSGTFSPDGVNCYSTPRGFYNDKAGASNPIGCLAGTFTSSTGSKICQPCAAPLISSAAATKCGPCADGTASSDGVYCKACPSGTFSVNGAACNSCQPGTFFAGGACHTTPAGFYNDKAGSPDPNGCLAGTYTDTPGSKVCNACASPLISYAAFTKCIPCADGLTSTDGQYCHACPAGTSSKGGSVCSSGNYHIILRDAADKNTLGYLSLQEDSNYGIYYVADLSNALTITSPTLGASGPVPLVATTESGTHGYNLAVALGNYGDNFSSSSAAYVWITESASNTKNEYFSESSDWYGIMAEPNVWVLGSADSNGRIPISLDFVGPNQSTVTCSRFFDDIIYTPNLLGATCANIGVDTEFDETILLFLVSA